MNDTEYTISVVIPAYNARAYIGRTIESVLRQTHPPSEIIVVDDGSTDNTAEVIRGFAGRVKLIEQANAGASAARNAGIEAATGDWIAFLDGDDEWLDQRLEKQADYLRRYPELVWVTGNYYECFCDPDHTLIPHEQGKSDALLEVDGYFEDYFDSYKASCCGHTDMMLIRRDVLYEAGLFCVGQPRMNDEDMWFRIAYRYPKVGYVKEPLAIYHRGVGGSIVKTHNHPEIVIELIQRHLTLAEEQNRQDVFRSVATAITKMWIHWSWEDQRAFQIRLLLKELGFLLNRWYKLALYILTIFPGLTLAMMPVLRKINKFLKIPL